jgi:hypothetical protein
MYRYTLSLSRTETNSTHESDLFLLPFFCDRERLPIFLTGVSWFRTFSVSTYAALWCNPVKFVNVKMSENKRVLSEILTKISQFHCLWALLFRVHDSSRRTQRQEVASPSTKLFSLFKESSRVRNNLSAQPQKVCSHTDMLKMTCLSALVTALWNDFS